MKACVDRETCIGCGLCESICPGVFLMDDEMKATVIVDPVPADCEGCAKESEDECPVAAITVE